MTDTQRPAATPESHDEHPVDEPHGAGDHGDDGGHDDHAHAAEALGPIDWAAWTVGVVGVAIGVVIALGFAVSTGAIGG